MSQAESVAQNLISVPLLLHLAQRRQFVRGGGAGAGQQGERILREQNLGVKEWSQKGIWAIVVSSNVASIRYEKKRQQLFVLYSSRRGAKARLYVYEEVPLPVAEQFFLAPSLGSYSHDVLRAQGYVTKRVIL